MKHRAISKHRIDADEWNPVNLGIVIVSSIVIFLAVLAWLVLAW